MIMQCLGAICGAAVVKSFQKTPYERLGGGANTVSSGYSKTSGLGAEIVGTFVLVYTVFSATDAKRNARDSHVPVSKTTVYLAFLSSSNCCFFILLPFYDLVFIDLNEYQILAPLPIGFAVFLVHLATIPITGTGINPARSLGAALIYNKEQAWADHVSLPNFPIFSLIFTSSRTRYTVQETKIYLV